MAQSFSAKYIPLDSEVEPNDRHAAHATGGTAWLVSLFILCTAINLLTVFFFLSDASLPFSIRYARVQDPETLRRPSQFIGFEKIPWPSPPFPRRLTNFPMMLMPINQSDPRRIYKNEPTEYLSNSGTITPEGRAGIVSQDVSTIAQFRAIDYGMEMCEFHMDIHANRTFFKKPLLLSAYRIDVQSPLNPATLNYRTRPPRSKKLDDIVSTQGDINWSWTFPCKMDEVITVEIACSTPLVENKCAIEWSQNLEHGAYGFYMVQYNTV